LRLFLALLALAIGACVRDHPAYYPPVWSLDGSRLFYAYERHDGSLVIREVEVASGSARDLSTARLQHRPAAFLPAPRQDCAAYLTLEVAAGKNRPRQAALYLFGRGHDASTPLWRGESLRGLVDLAWMPDGRSLVLALDSPGSARLARVAVGGGGTRVVADGLASVRAPAPSPDGRLVAFVARSQRNAPWALFVASAEDGARKVLAQAIFDHYHCGYWPAWSPDGNRLAYVVERYLSPTHAEVWVWERESGRHIALARCLAGGCLAPTWSPTGERLAFVRRSFGWEPKKTKPDEWPADIVVIDADGKNERTVVADGLTNLMPAWSPDGRRLAWNVLPPSGEGPHVVEVADVATCATRLAARDAASGLLLALARLARRKPGAAARAEALAAQLQGDPVAARAEATLAAHYRDLGDWSRTAAHAARAARALDGEERLAALALLATARARLGDPRGAVEACERILATRDDAAAAALRRRLLDGLAAQASLEKTIAAGATPTALATLVRLIRQFPEGPHTQRAARLVLDACRRMGPAHFNGRLLRWAADILGLAGLRPRDLAMLAQAEAAAGNAEKAMSLLLALGERKGLPPQQMAEALASVGEHLAAHGEAPAARRAYRGWRRGRVRGRPRRSQTGRRCRRTPGGGSAPHPGPRAPRRGRDDAGGTQGTDDLAATPRCPSGL